MLVWGRVILPSLLQQNLGLQPRHVRWRPHKVNLEDVSLRHNSFRQLHVSQASRSTHSLHRGLDLKKEGTKKNESNITPLVGRFSPSESLVEIWSIHPSRFGGNILKFRMIQIDLGTPLKFNSSPLKKGGWMIFLPFLLGVSVTFQGLLLLNFGGVKEHGMRFLWY